MAINVDVSKLDELILLISNSVDEKQKRIKVQKPFLFYSVSFSSSNNFINAEGSHTLTEDFV